ncbi:MULTISPECIES: OmpA family protein [Collimonas]|uniref:OmpA family protein n=2 Tax=Collimonas TaxID=202907 RepID=A0ABM5ZD98_9BURK|nr:MULTISPECIES: OmpA family protein [Collimonas]AMP17227.1 ompA family protein [Collimonas pratensis]
MSMNLLQLTQTALGGQVIQRISAHYGIDASKATTVFDTLVPTLIGSVVKKADTPEGARALYSAIMSPKVDPNIGTNLVSVIDNPVSLSNLGKIGEEHTVHLLGDKAGDVTNAVAQHTGVGISTVTSMTCVAAATLFGLIKNHLQASKGGQHTLISTLEHQVPFIQGKLPEGVWAALGLGTVAAFFNGIGSKLKNTLSAFHVQMPQAAHPSTSVSQAPEKKSGLAKFWWLWLLLALAALLFLMRGCNKESTPAPAPVVTPPAAVSAAPDKSPVLSLTTDKDGKATVVATVGSEAEKTAIMDDLKKVYGDAVSADIKVDAATKPADWIGKLPDLLPTIKLPNAELTIKGNNIEIGGAATDPKLALLDKTKTLFGSAYTVSLFDLSEAVANSKKKFEDALAALKPGTCTTADVVKAMNIYAFNFASGSFVIPKEDVLEFAKAVTAIKDCAKDAKLEIGGHTDNVGSSAVNMGLSQSRANAVRDFFVSKGIAATAFTTKAYGDSKPIGDNDTATGRFQNRRIEFVENK